MLDRAIRASFYILIFFLPVSIAMVESFSAFAILFFLIKRAAAVRSSGRKGFKAVIGLFCPAPTVLDRSMLCFIAACVLSMVFSQDHHLSIMGFVGKVLQGYFVYAAFLEAFTEARYLNNFLLVWFTAAFVTGISGLCQHFTGYDFLRGNLIQLDDRVSSSLRHANDFGAYIIAVCPIILVILLYWKSFHSRWTVQARGSIGSPAFLFSFFLIIFFVLLACLGLTFSRASWYAFFIAGAFIGLYNKKNMVVVLLLILGFISMFTPLMIKARDVSLVADNVKNDRQVFKPSGSGMLTLMKDRVRYTINSLGSGRTKFWEEGAHIVERYPLFGSGINTYSAMGHKYKITWGGYPHNSYLQMTAELGFVGLAAFLWMIGVLFWSGFRQLRYCANSYVYPVLLGALAGFAAYLVQSFFDTTFYSVQLSILLWIMAGLIMSLERVEAGK